MPKNKNLVIYTDGSCLGNPGPGGWAAIIIEDGKIHEISGGEPSTTNNRMEMKAVIEALKYIREHNSIETLPTLNINFFIDSNLIVQTLNCGWKKKKNKELWAEIEKLSAWLSIKWDWIKAHHVDKFNNQVDELANGEAKKQKSQL